MKRNVRLIVCGGRNYGSTENNVFPYVGRSAMGVLQFGSGMLMTMSSFSVT